MAEIGGALSPEGAPAAECITWNPHLWCAVDHLVHHRLHHRVDTSMMLGGARPHHRPPSRDRRSATAP